ncbi:MAG: phosphocholine cytidylyltransferase family protein [Patescibacteria group bacterium]|nr:phosphocholine cytidylyltransferase family protein [Patescibacteria group bacterium]MEA3499538.1 phosphocholine cytidylyltransferase family protein [Candidatus Neomarinimicrobiota bacterium]
MKIIILAAGIGSRLGNPFPKPLTPLEDGKTIMQRQVEYLSEKFHLDKIFTIVGFKKDMIMENFSEVGYIYNENFDRTNTSKSLLKGLKKFPNEDILWLNGDVVFDEKLLEIISPYIEKSQSFCCVNNASVGKEEVKYNVDKNGNIKEISKSVKNAIGEAVGINFISKNDSEIFKNNLIKCKDNDYFEKGLEMSIQNNNIKVKPINISKFLCMEVDFKSDLKKVNQLLK